MSTFITDLPGPKEEEYEDENENEIEEENEIENEEEMENQNFYQNTRVEREDRVKPSYIQNDKISSSIVKKKVKEPSFYEMIVKEFNEENFLLFSLIFIGTLTESNDYIRKGIGSGYSHLSVTLIKCIILVIIFIIIKKLYLKK